QLAGFPVQPDLVPVLRVEGIGIVAVLEFHEDVIPCDERGLVVSQELAAVGSLLVGDEGIVDNVGKLTVEALPRDGDETLVLRILSPLHPRLGFSRFRPSEAEHAERRREDQKGFWISRSLLHWYASY